MIENIFKTACIVLILFLASCIKEDYNTDNCPGQYTITPISPKELNSSRSVELENSLTTLIDPTKDSRIVEVGSNRPLNLMKGLYTAIPVKGMDEKVIVEGRFVSVTVEATGGANDPSDFVGGYLNLEVPKTVPDWGIVNYDVPTMIQTRLLVLKVKFEGLNAQLVQSVNSVVNGIAISRDLNNAFLDKGTTNRFPALKSGYVNYTLGLSGTDGYYTGSRRLLGLDGAASQILTLNIIYKGGVQKVYTFDITNDLNGFHTKDVVQPWIIQMKLRLGADFQANIEDWIAGPEVWIDAQH